MSQPITKSSLKTQYTTYPFIAPFRHTNALRNKVVMITGASAGIGKTSAHAFASSGASVACISRRQQHLDTLVSELKEKYSVPALAVAADISDADAAKRIVERVEEGLGAVDILLNCAGITRFSTLAAERDFSTWWRVLEVNLRGPVGLIHAVLPSMIQRQTGTLITVASTSGSKDIPYNTAYATSKAAVIKFHQDLATEVRRHGILSFSVHPGTVASELAGVEGAVNLESVEEEPEMQELMRGYEGLKYQEPELAAWTFVTLAAEERCWVLSGRYVDAEQDLGEVVREAEKEGGGRVEGERLYWLKVDEL